MSAIADVCVVAVAESFRGDGEIFASGMGVLPMLAASPNSLAILLIVAAGTVLTSDAISGVYCLTCSFSRWKAGRHLTPSTS